MSDEYNTPVIDLLSEDVKDIENLIAQKHGFYLSHDDPILILYTMNKLIMQQNIHVLSKTMKTFREEMALEAMKWSDSSNIAADKVLSMTMNVHERAMNNLLEKVSAKITTKIDDRFRFLQAQEMIGQQSLKVVVIMNLIASFVTLGSALFIII